MSAAQVQALEERQPFDDSQPTGGDRGDDFVPTEEDIREHEGVFIDKAELEPPVETPPVEEPPAVEPPAPAEEPSAVEPPTAENEPPVEPESEPQENQKPIMIPKSRFDEQTARKNAHIERLEAELKAAREAPAAPQQPETPAVDKTAFNDMMNKILDEDGDGAFEDFQKMVGSLQGKGVDVDVDALTAQIESRVAYSATYETLCAQHPQLDQNSPEYNDELAVAVQEIRDGYMAQNWDASAALRKATDLVMRPLELERQLQQRSEAPAQQPVVTPPTQNIDHVDVQAKTQVMQQQPSDLGGQSNEEVDIKVNVLNMTDEEYNALPEAVRARLRGDIV